MPGNMNRGSYGDRDTQACSGGLSAGPGRDCHGASDPGRAARIEACTGSEFKFRLA